MLVKPLVLAAAMGASGTSAQAFSFSFDWDGLPLCTSGIPNIVPNPRFVLHNVPKGTAYIAFRLKDLDVPGFNHGGGVVPYDGEPEIEPGVFTYKSPCPPNGVHTYEWTAVAQTRVNGGALAITRARRDYP